MSEYLVIRLYGPMASWGEIAVGESRHTAVHPSRSALLGLIGAALGIERTDDAGQTGLSVGYRFGIKMAGLGALMRDYHTVQAPPQQSKVRYRTRRQELADPQRLNTLLSAREYRCDSIAIVAIEATSKAPVALADLAAALQRPAFTLYLGRKSCPLAIPLAPALVQAPDLRTALDDTPQGSLADLSDPMGRQPRQWPGAADKRLFGLAQSRYYWEDGMQSGMEATLMVQRHDAPLSRRRWQFAPRQESVFLPGDSQ